MYSRKIEIYNLTNIGDSITIGIIDTLSNLVGNLILTPQKNGDILFHTQNKKYILINKKQNRIEIDFHTIVVPFIIEQPFVDGDSNMLIIFKNYLIRRYNIDKKLDICISSNLSTTSALDHYVFK